MPFSKLIWGRSIMVLKLHNVYAGYGGSDILKGVDLVMKQGSLTCIVGPNGAGKSTVLRVISGLLKPRLGNVTFRDRSLVGLSPRHILSLGIVQVPQEHSLFQNMTVRENVMLGGYILRDTSLKKRRLDGVEEIFPLVKERAQDLAGNLSGGQQRQVEFARCMMLDPALLLLDEPSLGLEPKTMMLIFETVKAIQSAGMSILLVEQNARAGLSIATNGVVMEGGQVRLVGTHQEILENPEIAKLYLGGTLSGTA